MADSDLTLAATLATELGVSDGDAKLPRCIAAASAAVLAVIRRKRVHYGAGLVELVAGFGTRELIVDVTPLLAVASVVPEDGSPITDFTFVVGDDSGVVFRAGRWPNTGAARGGLPPATDLDAGSQAPTITVTYTGGWVTPAQAASDGWSGPARSLPYDVEEAVLQTAVAIYRGGGRDAAIASESLGDYSVTFRDGMAGLVPPTARALLENYVRHIG